MAARLLKQGEKCRNGGAVIADDISWTGKEKA